MSAEGNWDYLIAQQGRGYFGNLPNLNSPLDQYQFGIHPILDLNIGEYYVSFTNLSLSMLLTLGLVLLLVLPMILRSLECRFLTIALCDAAEPWQLGSQDAATPMMQGIIDLHHDIFFFLILILVFVSRMLVRALWHFNEQTNPIPQRIVHGTTIEIIRTIFPSVIPLFIAIPSFALLYSMDGVLVDPAITIKAIGHQWYRSAPLNEGDLSATKCTGGSRSIWLTGHLPFPSSRD